MRFLMTTKPMKGSAPVPPDPRFMAAMGQLIEEMKQAGVLVDTGGLEPSSQGVALRLSGGQVSVIDGPFAEAKEVIGGYAIVNVKSKDEAIQLGKRSLDLVTEILGPSFEMETEIREMYTPDDF